MRRILAFLICSLSAYAAQAKSPSTEDPEFNEILSHDLSDLMVTSVSKQSQRLQDTAAAVYVITQEELRRAGVYSIPEALRLVPGMQVAKVANDNWAVSSRGFNGILSNKLLVLIDGRAIYTPVFSGTYWGDQSTSINDIDRIEVIRGPGASLYGANAVNGVINIITKSAEDTQGNFVSAVVTDKGRGVYEGRHGGQYDTNGYFRNYAQYYDGGSWYRTRTGFRMDNKTSSRDSYTFQGDIYGGRQENRVTDVTLTSPFFRSVKSNNDSYGGNLLGRYNHKISSDEDVSVQTYVDHYSRLEYSAQQRVSTADIQAQHSIRLDDRNNFIWGGGARVYYEDLQGTFAVDINDQYDTHQVLNVFAQDEYAIVPKTLYLTVGSKLEYNDYTGVEVQPSTRLAWHLNDKQLVWGAVSRAVRTPSNIENDVSILTNVTTSPLTEYRIVGNPNQESEQLVAYELGHRIQVRHDLTFDTTVYYNDFSKLQTIGTAGPSFAGVNGNTIVPYMLNNLGSGHVYGAEVASNWNVTNNWQLGGSYTYLKMNLDVKPGTLTTLAAGERLAPRNQFAIQSYYNVTESVHWDNMFYYVAHITSPVDDYLRYDTRVAWRLQQGMEVSVIGRNLLGSHEEFPSTPQNKIDRSFIGQVLWKF